MAAIDNLIKAVAKKKSGVDGFAMTWPENQPSPEWLSVKTLDELYENLAEPQRASIDKAKARGLADPS